MQLSKTSAICISGAQSKSVAEVLKQDLKELTSLNLPIREASARAGDIVLRLRASDGRVGAEGYLMHLADTAEIDAATSTGLFYGTRSLLQMLSLSHNRSVPRGEVLDWPDHAKRGFMLDVGRKFFSASFLQRYVRFMSFYKMNEFQLHLNDDLSVNGQLYGGFRLQSKRHPGLTSTDGSYSKRDIDRLEELAAAYHVQIIPEFDAPAHAYAFIKYRPDLGSKKYAKNFLDLANPETQKFLNDVWDEFLPWFHGDSVHIGADEYSSDPASWPDYKKYINQTTAFIKSKGKQVRMWGGLSVGGGAEGVDRDITVSLWYPGYYDPIQAVKDGYKLINTQDGYLYIVPFAGYYYQHLNTQFLYEHWLPNDFGDGKSFPYGSPAILGGMFAVWNDMAPLPYTEEDVHELVQSAMPTVSEKLWSGPSEGKRPYQRFAADFSLLGSGPGAQFNPPPVVVQRGNLARNSTVTASVRNSGEFGAQTLVDSRLPTHWIADASKPQWVQIDLGDTHPVGRVVLRWVPRDNAKQFTLKTSTDGVHWDAAFSTQSGSGGVEELNFPARPTRFIKLEMQPMGKGKQFRMFEFEVYQR
jgi:hypothetical protein